MEMDPMSNDAADPQIELGWAPFRGIFGDYPELRVFHEFVTEPEHEFTKSELASGSKVTRGATLDRVLERFLESGVIVEARKVGHIRLYKLNPKSPLTPAFAAFNRELTRRVAAQDATDAPFVSP